MLRLVFLLFLMPAMAVAADGQYGYCIRESTLKVKKQDQAHLVQVSNIFRATDGESAAKSGFVAFLAKHDADDAPVDGKDTKRGDVVCKFAFDSFDTAQAQLHAWQVNQEKNRRFFVYTYWSPETDKPLP